MGAKGVKATYTNHRLDELQGKYLTDEEYIGHHYNSIMDAYATSTMPEHKMIAIDSVYFKENPTAENQLSPAIIEKVGAFIQEHNLKAENAENDKELLWVIAAYPTKNWAKKVYPELNTEAAYNKMLDDFLDFARIGDEGSFSAHSEKLAELAKKVSEMNIVELHYQSKTADLRIPLHENHRFAGGAVEGADGSVYDPNVPTEEIFTMPAKYGANGTVAATRPFTLDGQLVEGLKMTFQDGKLVDYSAESGGDVFETFFKPSSEDVYLGEAAIVPKDSPIFQTGRTYYHILLDENAGAHIALGKALTDHNLKPGAEMDDNINQAAYHKDIVIGSEDLTVTATLKDGSKVDLLKDGKWGI